MQIPTKTQMEEALSLLEQRGHLEEQISALRAQDKGIAEKIYCLLHQPVTRRGYRLSGMPRRGKLRSRLIGILKSKPEGMPITELAKLTGKPLDKVSRCLMVSAQVGVGVIQQPNGYFSYMEPKKVIPITQQVPGSGDYPYLESNQG